MGKGDQKSRRGKINAGSYGKKRPKNTSKKPAVASKPQPTSKEKETKPKATKAKAETFDRVSPIC